MIFFRSEQLSNAVGLQRRLGRMIGRKSADGLLDSYDHAVVMAGARKPWSAHV